MGVIMELKYQIQKTEYDYLIYLLLIKIIGFLQLNENYVDKQEIDEVIEQLNFIYSGLYMFDQSNIISLGKKVIEDSFPFILEQMKNSIISPEIILSKDKFNQIDDNLKNDKKNFHFQNRGDLLSDYANGRYYRFFRNIQGIVDQYSSSRMDICAGETIYHSFARFYTEGVNEYFKYFEEMSRHNLINFQNQSQENGFCDCRPCYYWYLDSKQDLYYFNKLIKTKNIKLNHIEGNEHGPSALSLIITKIETNVNYDRRKHRNITLDDNFREILFQTLFNIVKSNYSISFDAEELMKLFKKYQDEHYVKQIMQYIISDEGIKKQRENNKYPIVKGGYLTSTTELELNNELDSVITFTKKLLIKR